MTFGVISLEERWEGYWIWLHRIKINKIVLLMCIVLIVVPLITHFYLSEVDLISPENDIHTTRAKLEALDDFPVFHASDLKMRIEEMLRIKGSVGTELRDIEAKRQKLHLEIASLNQKNDEIKNEILRQQMELERLKISVEQAEVAQREAIQKNTPQLALPVNLYPNEIPKMVQYKSSGSFELCEMYNCWDYSRCSITSGFPVYFYEVDDWEVESFLSTTIKQVLNYNPHIMRDPAIACAYLVLIGETQGNYTGESLTKYLRGPEYLPEQTFPQPVFDE